MILNSILVEVPGISDPWLAGMPDGSRASESDVAPYQSPVNVSGLTLLANSTLTFNVSGSVNNDPFPSGLTPDGDLNRFFIHGFDFFGENGIANIKVPINSLVGIFLNSSQPNFTSAPNPLDFSSSGNVSNGINYTTLSPQLKQVFFIGDGVNNQGVSQKVTIPQGATRLFLGTMDGGQWSNNFGLFDVKVNYTSFAPIQGDDNNNLLHGTSHDDYILGLGGNDTLNGLAGNDSLDGGTGNDFAYGSDGNDSLNGEWGNDYLDGGAANDYVNGDDLSGTQTGNDTVYGNQGNDTVYGGQGKDYVDGGAGNDLVDGWNGYGTGFDGNDTVLGGDGDDSVYGGQGNDFLDGGTGNDSLLGGEGIDKLYGNLGNDTLTGGIGEWKDTVDGGDGNDYLLGGDGNDYLVAGQGNDTADGGKGKDIVFGNTGNDFLTGANGNDSLDGGTGNDTLNGYGPGTDKDTLTGGANSDLFVLGTSGSVFYSGATSYGIITDLANGDKIQLKNSFSNYNLLKTQNLVGTSAKDSLITTIGGDIIGVIQDNTSLITSMASSIFVYV